MQLFVALELLMALLGLSWRAQGRSGTQNGAQKKPKSGPKVVQKLFKNRSQKLSQKGFEYGPQNLLNPGGLSAPFGGRFEYFVDRHGVW